MIDSRNEPMQTDKEALTEAEAHIDNLWAFLEATGQEDAYYEWSDLNE